MNSIWQGEFGDSYTRRHLDQDNSKRAGLWSAFIPEQCTSILEVGANKGHNLQAIAEHRNIDLYAAEPNELALQHLLEWLPKERVVASFADQLGFPDGFVDCVVTCGVLIHVSPDKILPSMREIHRVARKWIICGEYFAPSEEMVPYRGTKDTLWRRDWESLWLNNFCDLYLDTVVWATKRMTGFDNHPIWLFEKGPKRH